MNEKQEKEFNLIAEKYVEALHLINLFIENNDLDYNEVWNEANQIYEEDLSRCNEYN